MSLKDAQFALTAQARPFSLLAMLALASDVLVNGKGSRFSQSSAKMKQRDGNLHHIHMCVTDDFFAEA